MESITTPLPTFFALLRASLWGKPFSPAPGTDWAAIHKELRHHAIHNLPVELLAEVDPAHKVQAIQQAARNYAHWYALMGLQQEICRHLHQKSIAHAVIKGAAADIYYPQPLNRSMGDIDILVHPKDFERAIDALLSLGCTLHDTRNPRHTEFRKGNIAIELHRHFATLDNVQRVSTLDNMLFDALDRAKPASIEGYSFYMLPKLENGLVLMEHINGHMASGLGLRQIIDWMLYVDRELDDEVWFGEFQEVIRQVGLEKLAITVTRMCQLYLGLRPDITWCQSANDALCHRLMEHILAQGNFGRKQHARIHGTINVLHALDGNINIFQLLQRHGHHNWKALKKHPWLRPFAWLYQLCRYIRKGFRGKKPFASLLGAMRRKKQDTNLLDELDTKRKDHGLDYKDCQ